jgi:uncharacterized glyoxalase superfamily protein PhnB
MFHNPVEFCARRIFVWPSSDVCSNVCASSRDLLVGHYGPDGALMHGTVMIGDSMIELGDGPGVPPAASYVFVDDADELYQRALNAGATSLSGPQNQSYGHRSGGVKDPWGTTWYLASELKWFVEHVAEKVNR